MMIRGGHTIQVYRFVRDGYGDKSEALVGEIDRVVFQWANASSVGLRFHTQGDSQETSSISAVVFCPRDAAVKLQSRDRITLDGKKPEFQVVGDRAWDETHPSTGHDFGYYMMQVEKYG